MNNTKKVKNDLISAKKILANRDRYRIYVRLVEWAEQIIFQERQRRAEQDARAPQQSFVFPEVA
jgi:hypothetical protein